MKKLLTMTACAAALMGAVQVAHADACADSLIGEYMMKSIEGVGFRVLKGDQGLVLQFKQTEAEGGWWGKVMPLVALKKDQIAAVVTDKKLAKQSCAYLIEGFGGLLKLPKNGAYKLNESKYTTKTGYVFDIEAYNRRIVDVYNITQGDKPDGE